VCCDTGDELDYMLLVFMYRVLEYEWLFEIRVVGSYVSCIEIMCVFYNTCIAYFCIVCCDNDDGYLCIMCWDTGDELEYWL